MALRQLDVYLQDNQEMPSDILESEEIIDILEEGGEPRGRLVRLILEAEDTEVILDDLEQRLKGGAYRLVLSEVEATLPRVEESEEEEKSASQEETDELGMTRVSREEIYQDLNDQTQPSGVYHLMVILSTVVAAGGMLGDSVAVVIGAMVIAPLLGPSMALSLATTLGDGSLARRALRVNLLGLVEAFALSVLIGLVFHIDLQIPELAARAQIAGGDIVLALAAGIAGAVSVTQGLAAGLIGVMVAVALLPPLVACGILAGAGAYQQAIQAAMLLLVNLVAINLAGVSTFLIQGIRPSTWWEAQKARKSALIIVVFWAFLLAVLAFLVWYNPWG